MAMRVLGETDKIPFAFMGCTVEEFMADKTYYMVSRTVPKDSGDYQYYEVLMWDGDKLKFVTIEDVPDPGNGRLR